MLKWKLKKHSWSETICLQSLSSPSSTLSQIIQNSTQCVNTSISKYNILNEVVGSILQELDNIYLHVSEGYRAVYSPGEKHTLVDKSEGDMIFWGWNDFLRISEAFI